MNKKEAIERLNSLECQVKEMRKIIDASKTIFEKVKTYENALSILNITNPNTFNSTIDEIAYLKLKIITRALNEGWNPDFSCDKQEKWFPEFKFNGSRFRFYKASNVLPHANGCGGAHLSCKNEEIATYLGTKFVKLWNEYLL